MIVVETDYKLLSVLIVTFKVSSNDHTECTAKP